MSSQQVVKIVFKQGCFSRYIVRLNCTKNNYETYNITCNAVGAKRQSTGGLLWTESVQFILADKEGVKEENYETI